MILRDLREINHLTDNILVYGNDGSTDRKILTDSAGKISVINVDIPISDLKTVLDAIDANTDTLESITQSIRNQLDVVTSSRASEATTQLILSALGQNSGTDIITELQNLILNTDGLATETTLLEVKNLLSSIDTKLQLVIDQLDVKLSTRSSELTLTNVLTELQNIEAKDFATETTLALIQTAIDAINLTLDVALSTRASELTLSSVLSQLQTLNLVDFSTETTLALIKTAIDAINADLDVALSTRASESTLLAVKLVVESIDTDLDVALSTRSSEATLLLVKTAIDSINASIDVGLSTRSSESTSQSILDSLGEESGTNILIELKNLESNTSGLATEATLSLIKSAIDSIDLDFDVALSTRASESTLVNIKTNLDDIKIQLDTLNATDFATESTSINILNSIGQQSGTNVLVELQNLNIPLSTIIDLIGTASGTDVITQLQCICDKLNAGIDVTIQPSKDFETIQLVWDDEHLAPNKFEWQEVLEYTVPMGFNLNAVSFDSKSAISNESARVVSKEIHGSFDSLNDTYTDSAIEWGEPKFGTKLYVFVTTAIGAGANDNITITYTNEDGIGGRTATVTIPKNSVVGTRLRADLQAGDKGIRDITNVTHSELGQAGEFDLESVIELFYLTLTLSGVQYKSSAVSLGGIVVLEGEKLFLQYESNSAVLNERRVSLVATLVETSNA